MDVLNLLLVLLLFFSADCSKQPRVKIENGILVGKYAMSHNGKRYQSFEGIPYAKPPIDDKRFREPEPLGGPWMGEWNATEPGSPCMQYDHFSRRIDEDGNLKYSVIGDEDCLFLNVYTKDGYVNKKVVFVIHGGAFMFGASHQLGPDYMIDMDDIVIVTANYRLGPLGFLTTGDAISPGNNGLKDQALALDWVQRNIEAFGGNPRDVTLVGLSAGGASVHYHYLSELSWGKFQRGYSFSGSALCPWAFVEDGVEKSQQLATYMGCPTTDSKMMVKCLRRRPAKKIVEQVEHFQIWLYNPFAVFGPVAEIDSLRPFLKDKPRELLLQGRVQDLPWITSFTSEEGLYPAADFVTSDELMKHFDQNWDSIAPSLLFYKENQKNQARAVKEYYMGSRPMSPESRAGLVQMMSDRVFIGPCVESATIQARVNTQPVYVYSYEYEGTTSISQALTQAETTLGVSHGDDFAYVIKFIKDTHIKPEDSAMANFLLEILHSYMNIDAPPASLNWTPVSKSNSADFQYLRIKSVNNVSMESNSDVGNVAFLRKLLDGATLKDEL